MPMSYVRPRCTVKKGRYKRRGRRRVRSGRHGHVDENGNYSSFAAVVRKDDLNERLHKVAQENAEKQIEKPRENARKKQNRLRKG